MELVLSLAQFWQVYVIPLSQSTTVVPALEHAVSLRNIEKPQYIFLTETHSFVDAE